jgi:hypothetical protein
MDLLINQKPFLENTLFNFHQKINPVQRRYSETVYFYR